jgi:hypothetical protein
VIIGTKQNRNRHIENYYKRENRKEEKHDQEGDDSIYAVI